MRISDLSSDVCSTDLSPPVLEAAEHDLDAVSAFVAALVVFDGLVPYFPARDAGRDALFLQGIAEPVGIIAPVGEHPLRFGQTVEQSGCARVIADLPGGHEEADRAAICIGHGMRLGVHTALDRKSVGEGQSVSVSGDLGGGRSRK